MAASGLAVVCGVLVCFLWCVFCGVWCVGVFSVVCGVLVCFLWCVFCGVWCVGVFSVVCFNGCLWSSCGVFSVDGRKLGREN